MRIDRSILPPGRIGLAVSGGADSVALAFLLTKGGKKYRASERFVVLHVDHGIRPDSHKDCIFVQDLAERLHLSCFCLETKVVPEVGESIEMAARRVRLNFFARAMKEHHLDAIATGHQMDDVAETFLMRLRRASGPVGLSGIKPISTVGAIRFVRPLLGCRDYELRAYLEKYGEKWCEDLTNSDLSIERNHIRHVIIPFLEQNLDPHLVEHLGKTSGLLARAVARAAQAGINLGEQG